MSDFWMKLHAIDSAFVILNSIERIIGQSSDAKTGRHGSYLVTVAHPNIHLIWLFLKKQTAPADTFQPGITKFAIGRRLHITAHIESQNLQSITDSQERAVE